MHLALADAITKGNKKWSQLGDQRGFATNSPCNAKWQDVLTNVHHSNLTLQAYLIYTLLDLGSPIPTWGHLIPSKGVQLQ
uniref:Uncharacterized protein n=1 Tax=Ipomoea trifida TaxID=35884 RepID=A0A958_IPOTF|nr:hypothetical protein [Ipomoea trifida]